ncbi:MAG: 3-methyl-2-oxobutanoate hydroxymethyltransferase [Deltaproteobacteria bacterium]|jgi:3-methyl-2-oxobutanoate hydroxymethyltransferase|nr:3-methyl-2-oxobutanoate hydroxymethyltransferase [Deltaproteobacteria bacterium]
MSKKKITIPELKAKRENGGSFAMVTVYDYPMASLVEKSSIELILVGDSVGMVIQGLNSTVPVTMTDMLYHTRLVRRGTPNTFIVGDMPFMSYQACEKEAIHNAGALMQAGADCVKMEGTRFTAPKVEAVVKCGIPVVGHIGLTPQTAAAMGGFKLQGKDLDSAKNLMADAVAYQEAGVFAIVLECLPTALGQAIHKRLNIPTIGVGAGHGCTGYNLNAYDILGIFDQFVPKFVKRYRDVGKDITGVFDAWRADIENGQYPLPEHNFNVFEKEINELFKS